MYFWIIRGLLSFDIDFEMDAHGVRMKYIFTLD